MIVIDASVVAKLFLPEADQAVAEALVTEAIAAAIPMIAPSLLLYETISIAQRYEVDVDLVLALLDQLGLAGLRLMSPTRDELVRARDIAATGHAKSGRPELYDSIYHAMAIERDGIFITADSRHVAKAGMFGHVALLADWRLE